MTPDQIALVQSSFAAASPRLDELAQRFYADLFEHEPEVRNLFPTDLTAQRAKLGDELVAIVDALDSITDLAARTVDLGARHAGYGVLPEHYGPVGVSLRRALAGVLGERYDDEVDEAWRLAYNLVAETMVHGASQPPGGASRRSLRNRVV